MSTKNYGGLSIGNDNGRGLLISLLYLALHIAAILFVVAIILWGCHIAGITIDAWVYKIGKIIVILLIAIAVIQWALPIIRSTY